MTTRRTFLTHALGLLALPVAAKAVSSLPKAGPAQAMPCHEYRITGVGVKVPSNRFVVEHYRNLRPGKITLGRIPFVRDPDEVRYEGDWDGTFKTEVGCSNPAYVLADLYERTGTEPDWVVARKVPVSPFAPMVMDGMHQLLKPQLNWAMLYDWGRHSDEMDGRWTEITHPNGSINYCHGLSARPRFTVNAYCATPADMDNLRETLRMHCLSWQATDPHWRTSWPGIPYHA